MYSVVILNRQLESESAEDKEIESVPDIKEIEALNASEDDILNNNSKRDKKKEAQFKDVSNDKK